jgi:hypothetical protein
MPGAAPLPQPVTQPVIATMDGCVRGCRVLLAPMRVCSRSAIAGEHVSDLAQASILAWACATETPRFRRLPPATRAAYCVPP